MNIVLEKRCIVRRLDDIEKARRAQTALRYRSQYPNLDETEIGHLAELLASTRIRLIAENALALLPNDHIDQVLHPFEG